MTNNADLQTSQTSESNHDICRDFLRNVCKRGKRCKYFHPNLTECEKIRRAERVFCHDFQNSVCRRVGCKFLHYSREDEEYFRVFGHLPDEVEDRKDSVISLDGNPPICKDYLNGSCSRGSSCKYRHISHPFDKNPQIRNSNPDLSPRQAIVCNPQTVALPSSANSVESTNSVRQSTFVSIPTPQQSSLIHQSNVLTSPDSILSPVNDVYLSSGPIANPVVGVIDHVGVSAPTIQHTVYAHHSSMGTFTPLVSVSSAAQCVPCSSVLAVVAESPHHRTVLQHPVTSQTTYHLLPAASPAVQEHIFSTGSAASSSATLFTIPMAQYPCSNTTAAVIGTRVAANGTGAQHSAVLTTVLPANQSLTSKPTPGYSSYNLVQISPSSAVETVPLFNQPLTGTTQSTSTVTSNPTLFAAVTAAGYVTQHVPILTTVPICQNDPMHAISRCSVNSQSYGHGISVDPNAASNNCDSIPAVSVATALVASEVLASQSQSEPAVQIVFSNRLLHPSFNDPRLASHQSSSSPLDSDVNDAAPSGSSISSSSANSTVSPDSPNDASHRDSEASFTRQEEQDAEHAQTAAAVAAAACIGAMFSQPLSDGRHSSSSMAAMLDNLIHHHQHHAMEDASLKSSEDRRARRLRLKENASDSASDRVKAASSDQTNDTADIVAEHTAEGLLRPHKEAESSGSQIRSHVANRGKEQSTPTSFHGHDILNFSKASAWSSVATTVASAAQAAAAAVAAVAATAAVTHSAKFFQMSRKQKGHSQSNTQCVDSGTRGIYPRCSLDNGGDRESDVSTAVVSARTTLSPDTTVTMTNAAAAAAMAAAAASAAAKQQMYSKLKKTVQSDSSEHLYPKQVECAQNFTKKFYNTEFILRPESFNEVRYQLKRQRRYNQFHRRDRRSRGDVEADDEHGMYDDDDMDDGEAGYLSPDDPSNVGNNMCYEDRKSEFVDIESTSNRRFHGYPAQSNMRLSSDKTESKTSRGHPNSSSCNVSKRNIATPVSTPVAFTLRRSRSATFNFVPRGKVGMPLFRCKSYPLLNQIGSPHASSFNHPTRSGFSQSRTAGHIRSADCSKSPVGRKRKFVSSSRCPPETGETHRRLMRTRMFPRSDGVILQNSLQSSGSPESILIDDYGGQHDMDDLDYLDAGDDYVNYAHDRRRAVEKQFRRSAKSYPRDRLPSNIPSGFHTLTYLRQQQALRAENARLRRKLAALMRQSGDLRAANEILLEQNAKLRHSNKHTNLRKSKLSSKNRCPSNRSREADSKCSLPTCSLKNLPGTVSHTVPDLEATTARGVYVSSPTASNSQQPLQAVHAHTIFPSALVASAVPGTITLSAHQSLAAVQFQAPLSSNSVSTQPALVAAQSPHRNPLGFYQHQLRHCIGSIPVSISSISTESDITAGAPSTLQICHYPVQSNSCVPFSNHQTSAVPPTVLPVGAPSAAVTLLVGQPATAYAAIQPHHSIQIQNGIKAEPPSVNLTPVPYILQSTSTALLNPGVPVRSVQEHDVQTHSTANSTRSARSTVMRENRFKNS